MPFNTIITEKLNAYKLKDKFSDAAWERRGLIPSDSDASKQMQKKINSCLDELLLLEDTAPAKVKRILNDSLGSFNSSYYDTEEREFIADSFHEIANITEVEFKNELNRWLYGWLMVAMMKIKELFNPERVIEVHSQNCTKCDVNLETYILKKQTSIPDFAWFIVQCNNCNEYNLLSLCENIKESRNGNYKHIEQLPKDQFTEDQAWDRLDKIKVSRE